MQIQFIPILGYLLAFALGVFAYIAWRRSQSLHDLLVEAANRFELSRRHVQQLEVNNHKLSEKMTQARDSAHKNAQAIEEQRQRHLQAIQQLEDKLADISGTHGKCESRLDNYQQQISALTEQLSQADHERKNLRTQLKDSDQRRDKKLQDIRAPLETRLEEWKNKFHTAEKERQHAIDELRKTKASAHVANPDEVRELKRRLAHAEHLYTSMKGLREMADERNQNWERALGLLAGWVLQKHGADPRVLKPTNNNIGQMVGAALEKINATLVDDDKDEDKDNGHLQHDNLERTASAANRATSTTS